MNDEILEMVNAYIPEGYDPLLHVDRRKHITFIIEDMLNRNIIYCNVEGIKAICLCWRDILHNKFQILN